MEYTKVSYLLGLSTILLGLTESVLSSDPSSAECPPWFFYNTTTKQCQCYHNEHLNRDIHCTENDVHIGLGNCMTYESNVGTFFAKCYYFQLPHNIVMPGEYFSPPKNVSELDDFMCGSINA